MEETGVGEGPAREVDFRLRFTTTGGSPVEVDVTQMMNDTTLTGLGPGADPSISYDRDDPTVVVWHAANVRIVEGLAVAAPPPEAPPFPAPT